MLIDFAQLRKNRWVRLAVLFVILVVISLALAVLFKHLLSPLEDELGGLAWLAYLIVFGTSFLSNLTVIAPVSVGTSIMVTAAGLGIYHPVVIALFAALGGALGEIGGYLAGTLGKKVAFNDYPEAYERVSSWVNKYGMWAIAFIAFQPVLPIDAAGMVAGATKMPAHRFLIACFLGKFPKYILICYMFKVLQHYLWFF
jgi:uncharacterized membrane protein YdjX (TVP38/TMEM64 family)